MSAELRTVDLQIEGMTCASCAARIEKKLNRVDGVDATVNYATETARVHAPAAISRDDLVGQVEALGYAVASPPEPSPPSHDGEPGSGHHVDLDDAVLRQRVLVSAVLSLPVLLMSMVPALQFDHWQWISLTLASPVVLWGGWPFHRAALHQPAPRRRQHGHAHLGGHALGLRLVALRPAVHPGGRRRHAHGRRAHAHGGHRRPRDLPRGRRRGDHPDPRRPVVRGPGQAPVRCRSARPARARGTRRGRAPRRPGGAAPHRGAAGRGPLRGASGREDRHRRRGGRGQLGRRHVAAHRRTGARRGRRGRRRGRGHGQRRRPARGGGHWRGVRHRPRPHRRPGLRRPVRQGPGAAPGRSDLGGVRAGRDRAGPGLPWRGLAGSSGASTGVAFAARRRGRADHRLPVRPRTGHPDRPAGGHRPGRPARRPHQGPGGPRVHPGGRHDRARQDRHHHRRPHAPHRRGGGRGRRRGPSCSGWPARSRTARSTRSPPPSPPGREPAGRPARRSPASPTSRAGASPGPSTAPASWPGGSS